MFVSGSLLNFASYGFAAQSLLASLESVQVTLRRDVALNKSRSQV